MASDKIQNLTDTSFEQTIKSSTPTLVDFWAEWCMPCRRIAPAVEALATEYAGRLTVAKLNVDESQEVPIRLGVQSIPTLMVFKDGTLVDRLVGAHDKDTIKKMVDRHL